MRTGSRFIRILRVVGVTLALAAVVAIPLSAVAEAVVTPVSAATGTTSQQPRPVVRVAVRQLTPFVEKSAEGRYSGFSIDLLRDIADEEGFDLQYVEVGNVGEQLAAVQDGRADMAIGAISITAAREQLVDFSTSMFESGLQALAPATSGTLPLSTLLRDAFSPVLLTVFVLMILGTVITGTIVWLWERRHGNEEFTASGIHGALDGIWWATVTLFTIGYGDKVPHKKLSRFITMGWMFVGVLMVAIITAQVTSTVTVQQMTSTVTSVDHLAGKDVVTLPGTTSWDFLVRNGVVPRAVDGVDQGYEAVRSHSADAFVYDAAIVEWLASNRSGVQVAGPIIHPQNYGIAVPKGSPYLEAVDQGLLLLREDGTYDRLKKSYFG